MGMEKKRARDKGAYQKININQSSRIDSETVEESLCNNHHHMHCSSSEFPIVDGPQIPTILKITLVAV